MGVVVSLFDESGNMVRPWAEAGHTCYCFDIQNVNPCKEFELSFNGGSITYFGGDLSKVVTAQAVVALKPDILFGFPPCTDLAVSGALRFAAKAAKDPDFQKKAMGLVHVTPTLGEIIGCPWMFENPVSVISTLYRKPDFIFHPYEFGGYLPTDDVHPRYPYIIPPRDAYPKKTCLWTGNGFQFPQKKPVPEPKDFVMKLGGKSARTKKIRSETARGFAQAVFEANAG